MVTNNRPPQRELDAGAPSVGGLRQHRQTIVLPRKVPVHLLYWTAWVDSADTVHFRRDVYDRDWLYAWP